MSISESELIVVLSDLLNGSERPTALRHFARIKYPMRELQPHKPQDGTISCRLTLSGWEYKHRGPKPKEIPILDMEEIRLALNSCLPNGLYVSSVKNQNYFVEIYIQEEKEDEKIFE